MAVAARVEIVAERAEVAAAEVFRRLAEEAQDVAQHRPVARLQHIGGLSDEAAQIFAGIFEPAAVERDGERHVARPRLDAEVAEQRGEVRIGALVVDDEAAVDADAAPVERVAVAAEPVGGLEQRHVADARQQPRGR